MAQISTRPTILIVDDEPSNLSVLGDALSGSYKVIAANSGAEALRAAAGAETPGLILLDVMMPDMNGFDVCARLKQENSTARVPVIFVTSLDDKINEEMGFKAGAVDYIYKPISPPVVQARVKVHLEHTLYREYLELLLKERTDQLQDMQHDTDELSRMLGSMEPG